MTRIGHLKKSTTLFPQRIKDNTSRYERKATAIGSNSSDELWDRKKDTESPCDFTGFEFSTSSTIVPYKEYKKSQKSAVKCFLCNKVIKNEHLSEHLLFSEAECGKCNVVFKDCQDFQVWLVEKNMRGDICEHVLEFSGDPLEKLKTCLARDIHEETSVLTESESVSMLRKYISGIKSLSNVLPWQQAIAEFMEFEANKKWYEKSENYLKSKKEETLNKMQSNFMNEITRTESNSTLNTYMQSSLESAAFQKLQNNDPLDLTHKELCAADSPKDYKVDSNKILDVPVKTSKKKRKSAADPVKKAKTALDHVDKKMSGSKQSKCSDFVETPSDGFYYVVRHAVTECPNCYASLSPQDFAVNIVTFLMTAVCSDCNLTIYIVHDPPDDSAPRICIITDQKAGTGKDVKPSKTKRFKQKSLPEQ